MAGLFGPIKVRHPFSGLSLNFLLAVIIFIQYLNFWMFLISSSFARHICQNLDERGRDIVYECTLPSLLVMFLYSFCIQTPKSLTSTLMSKLYVNMSYFYKVGSECCVIQSRCVKRN